MQIALVLGLLAAAVACFATEALAVDVVTLLLLVALVGAGILSPDEAFAGFASENLVILGSLFVCCGALQRTGFVDALGARLAALARGGPRALLLVSSALVAAVSAFINNTTATAIFVNPVIGAARRTGTSPSRLLLPLAYASILGGTCTLIGTSTNIAVSGALARMGHAPVGLFELAPVGLAIVATGLVYLVLVAPRVLPDHPPEALAEAFALREYLSEVVVRKDSPLVGQRVFESDLARMDFRVLRVVRGDTTYLPDAATRIAVGDVLVLEGSTSTLLAAQAKAGVDVRADRRFSDRDLATGGARLVEMLVMPHGELEGATMREVDFRERYGITVLAVSRHGAPIREGLADFRLRAGDLLLVQGPADQLAFLRRHRDLWVVEELPDSLLPRRGLLVAASFVAAVVAGGSGALPVSIAFLAAALVAVLSRAITIDEAYDAIDWQVLILIGGMTAVGLALEKTGGAALLADGILSWLAPMGTLAVLAGFCGCTVALTQPMSNAAAALVVLPVAMRAATTLGADPRTFGIAVMLAASVSLVTPLEPSCLLVYGTGKYRPRDFVRLGGPLTLLLLVLILALVPWRWPLGTP